MILTGHATRSGTTFNVFTAELDLVFSFKIESALTIIDVTTVVDVQAGVQVRTQT